MESGDDEWLALQEDSDAIRRAQADQKQRADTEEYRYFKIAWIGISVVLSSVLFSLQAILQSDDSVVGGLIVSSMAGVFLAFWIAGISVKTFVGPVVRATTPMRPVEEFEERYGARHRLARKQWAGKIRADGGVMCAERVCIMPNRWIAHGELWHLAHDHEHGSARTYLGPAHPECNQAEALGRGKTWPGSPSRSELLARVKARGAGGGAAHPVPERSLDWNELDPWTVDPNHEPPFLISPRIDEAPKFSPEGSHPSNDPQAPGDSSPSETTDAVRSEETERQTETARPPTGICGPVPGSDVAKAWELIVDTELGVRTSAFNARPEVAELKMQPPLVLKLAAEIAIGNHPSRHLLLAEWLDCLRAIPNETLLRMRQEAAIRERATRETGPPSAGRFFEHGDQQRAVAEQPSEEARAAQLRLTALEAIAAHRRRDAEDPQWRRKEEAARQRRLCPSCGYPRGQIAWCGCMPRDD